MSEEIEAPKHEYRVEYAYNGSAKAWFHFHGTNAEFAAALAEVFRDPFIVYNMTIVDRSRATLPKDAGVTQGDREAAADYMDEAGWGICSGLDTRAGHADTNISGHHLNESQLVQAFAAHRHQSQAAVTGAVEAASYACSVLSAIITHGPDTGVGEHNIRCAIDARTALANFRAKT